MLDPEVLKMKVADLKRELKLRGLSTAGNKTDLQDRLHGSLIDGELSLEDTAISGEDLLDDEVLTDEEEKAILSQSDENPLLLSPVSESTSKMCKTTESDTVSAKKIVLKRKTSTLNPTISILTSKENNTPILEKVMKMSEKNPISVDDQQKSITDGDNLNKKAVKVVPELSWQQRLELRAKKFGSNPDLTKSEPKSSGGSSTVNAQKQLEALKKRAERFGVVAPKMVDIQVAEKLQKRKERFGQNIAGALTLETSANYVEKAKLRLDRFQSDAK